MKCTEQIDAIAVGSICIDSNSYNSISDVFKMNNLICDITNILSGKRTLVGKLRNEGNKNISVKYIETKDYLIGVATCYGEKAYQMLQINNLDTNDFAYCYIDLITSLAKNIRCKIALSTAKGPRIE